MHNPLYTDVAVENSSGSERVTYPAYEDISLQIQNSRRIDVSTVGPRIANEASDPSHYLSPRTMRVLNNGRYEMMELPLLKEESVDETNEHKTDTVIVPTDPVTGYSTLLRADNGQSTKSQDLVYDSIKVNNRVKPSLESPSVPLLVSPNNKNDEVSEASRFASRVPCPLETLKCSEKDVCMISNSDDNETGYCTLKDDRPQPPPGTGPLYDTLNLNVNGASAPKSIDRSKVTLDTYYTGAQSPSLTSDDQDKGCFFFIVLDNSHNNYVVVTDHLQVFFKLYFLQIRMWFLPILRLATQA